MQQVEDFLAESEALAAVLAPLPEADWTRITQFKGWSVNDVVVHLLFWNRAADLSLSDPEAFAERIAAIYPRMQVEGMRPVENADIPERGPALFALWRDQFRAMVARWADVDPKRRLKWAGPDMSARSSITARQMETWAHGQEIFDLLGRSRPEADRIRNIVVLGVNTFGWSHQVQGLEVPARVPRLQLTAPSGAVWEFGDPDSADLIAGPAVDFARVVTQTRSVADTDLQLTGPVAHGWMQTAQCFAGGREVPPAPGTRFRQG
ncbi:TIGR03084 family metal-binding protein [Pseudodonghicola flavimaris]|uniref:TIGR03084 family metal-binding protein n=1 Tax=Pseudodonghicola flavimaris TaxID=3050036 RepID=A0ABT7F6D5_9RHOB|nr:TIGR03084 family metal-binding protein [Pseudodonghicola flavimaris]MDK3020167.1 TIGR03084 family metal-binding protein [Pseudodonghicola flavimaris]